MADNLGPGEYNGTQLAINFFILNQANLEAQLIDNKETLALKQKESATKLAEIHFKYNQEESLIRTEMRSLADSKLSTEYYNLLAELEELQNEEEMLATATETECKDYETRIQLENDNIETQIQAVQQDKEALEEMQKKNIEG